MKIGEETFTHKDKVRFINRERFPKHTYDILAITHIPRNMCVCGFSLDDPDHSCDNPTPLREVTGHHQKIHLDLTGLGLPNAVTGALLKKVDN
jgi:hypothetical protein